MNRYSSISLIRDKSKLYFSRPELNKIFEYYSNGVAKGTWKDYSIDFYENEASFHFYKNHSENPQISILKKQTKKNKKNNFQLKGHYNMFLSTNTLDELFIFLKRKNLKIVKK